MKPNDPSEDASQQKMVFVDAEKYIGDNLEYTITYGPNGLATCKRDEPEVKIPEQGDPGWVSYTFKFSAANPAHEIRCIKISPHSKTGKALVKKV